MASLVARLRSGSAGSQEQPRSQELAAAELSSLMIKNVDNQADLARAGAIEPLVALLHSGSAAAQGAAAGVLGQLAYHNAENCVAI